MIYLLVLEAGGMPPFKANILQSWKERMIETSYGTETTTTFNSAQLDLQSINGIRFLAGDENEWRKIDMP
jgi:hypothetical protein